MSSGGHYEPAPGWEPGCGWTAANVYVPPKVGVMERIGGGASRIANSIVEKFTRSPPTPAEDPQARRVKYDVECDRDPRIVRVDAPVDKYFDNSDTLKDTILRWSMGVGVARVYYFYQTAPYEGMGHALIQFDSGLWGHADLGHCSCYGPEEHLPQTDADAQPLAELLTSMDSELIREHIYDLLEAMSNDES